MKKIKTKRKKKVRMEEEGLCKTCVKAKRDERGNLVRCMVLKEELGRSGKCFAFSDNPLFWDELEKYERRIKK